MKNHSKATFNNSEASHLQCEMDFRTKARLSSKIEIVFPISSELLNFAVAKKYHWGFTETLVDFHWTKLIAMKEFWKLP